MRFSPCAKSLQGNGKVRSEDDEAGSGYVDQCWQGKRSLSMLPMLQGIHSYKTIFSSPTTSTDYYPAHILLPPCYLKQKTLVFHALLSDKCLNQHQIHFSVVYIDSYFCPPASDGEPSLVHLSILPFAGATASRGSVTETAPPSNPQCTSIAFLKKKKINSGPHFNMPNTQLARIVHPLYTTCKGAAENTRHL